MSPIFTHTSEALVASRHDPHPGVPAVRKHVIKENSGLVKTFNPFCLSSSIFADIRMGMVKFQLG
jgi:hypothetical protein